MEGFLKKIIFHFYLFLIKNHIKKNLMLKFPKWETSCWSSVSYVLVFKYFQIMIKILWAAFMRAEVM